MSGLIPVTPIRAAIQPCSHQDVLRVYPHAVSPYVAFFPGRMVSVLGDAIGLRYTQICQDCGEDLGSGEVWVRV